MIEIRNVKKSFSNKPVLRDVNLLIPEGEAMVIVGRSGFGKSVLLKSIIGLIHPDQGAIYLDGKDICSINKSELYEIRKIMGMLFQSAALFDSMSVEENIALPLKEHTNLTRSEIRKKVLDKLRMVGLESSVDKMILSGG